jgi:hypothetical protein
MHAIGKLDPTDELPMLHSCDKLASGMKLSYASA